MTGHNISVREGAIALAVILLLLPGLVRAQDDGAGTTPPDPFAGEATPGPGAPEGYSKTEPSGPFTGESFTSPAQSTEGKGAPKTAPSAPKFEDRVSEAENTISSLRDEVARNSHEIDKLWMALESDREAIPRPASDAPPLNLSCDADVACLQCMSKVIPDLEGMLRLYETLRIIYDRTKTYNDNAILIGDTFSGFHQLEQQAWYQTKLDLVNNFKGFQRAYDAKLEEFNDSMDVIFQRLDACTPAIDGDVTDAYQTVLFLNTLKAAYRK